METVTLSAIVMKVAPEIHAMLTSDELDYVFVLRYGLDSVGKDDIWEIIQHSICHRQTKLLH